MERIALISDIHGNVPALEAALDDAVGCGVSRVFCLGDLVGKGPQFDRVVDVCRALWERVIQGNWDDGLARTASDDPTLRWRQERLEPERPAYLRALPNSLDFVMSGRRIRLLHALPRGVNHRVHQRDSDEKTEFTGHGFEPDVVGYGDIHQAYQRTFHLTLLFNAGSVGNPLDLPLACYAILEGSLDEAVPGSLAVNVVRVPYDIERAIREAAGEGMPGLQSYAKELRAARYRGSKE